MNSKHFPDLELCKRLTEAGFPETEMERIQNSFFKDWLSMTDKARNEMFDQRCFENLCSTSDVKRHYRCPSIAELLDMLMEIEYLGDKYEINIVKTHGAYSVFYKESGRDRNLFWFYKDIFIIDENLANALAEMYLWLKENNHL